MSYGRARVFTAWNAGKIRQRLAVVLCGVLLVTFQDLPEPRPAAAAPAHAAPAKPKPACPDGRADLASAAIAAKLCGQRVEATGKRTETTQVFANPDGTVTEDRALAPVRVKSGDKWDDVDLTLIGDATGAVVPKVHARALKLSGA